MKIDEEGYIVVEPQKIAEPKVKGFKCGKCGKKFSNDRKPFGFVCVDGACPMQTKPSWEPHLNSGVGQWDPRVQPMDIKSKDYKINHYPYV